MNSAKVGSGRGVSRRKKGGRRLVPQTFEAASTNCGSVGVLGRHQFNRVQNPIPSTNIIIWFELTVSTRSNRAAIAATTDSPCLFWAQQQIKQWQFKKIIVSLIRLTLTCCHTYPSSQKTKRQHLLSSISFDQIIQPIVYLCSFNKCQTQITANCLKKLPVSSFTITCKLHHFKINSITTHVSLFELGVTLSFKSQSTVLQTRHVASSWVCRQSVRDYHFNFKTLKSYFAFASRQNRHN